MRPPLTCGEDSRVLCCKTQRGEVGVPDPDQATFSEKPEIGNDVF